jgi:hypothetical protein
LEEIYREDDDQRFEWMAEAGFHGDEVIRNREKHKCPGEEA